MNSMHVVSYISLFLMTDFPALEIIQFSQEVVPRIEEYVQFVLPGAVFLHVQHVQ